MSAPVSPRPFTPLEPGTPEAVWLADPRWEDVPVVAPAALGAERLVVLAAHPDDETLGVGALVADLAPELAAAAGSLTVVLATDGSASHPDSALWSPHRLGELREREFRHAVDLLAPGASIATLGLADGTLADDPGLLRERVAEALGPADASGRAREVLLAPYAADGHPDHDTLGAVAAELARARGSRLWYYPIWLWHWAHPDEFPWARALAVPPSAAALHAKAAAIAAHRSQVAPLSPLPGDEALLPPHVLARFARVTETLIAGDDGQRPDSAGAEADRRDRRRSDFDAMLADTDDPWDAASWYERRKHALTVALRTRERYAEVLEIGCATGALTTLLAGCADHVTAVDGSASALAVARRRDLPGVTWLQAEVPYDLAALAGLPVGSADLVVISEVAYFLTGTEFLALLRAARRALRPGGEIALIDWRRGSADLPLDGDLAHAQARTALADLPHRLSYRDDSIRADVWGGAPLTPGERR
ncbi:MAG: bifunctional PIG-L family deacetylase/class I SAM-dependent methyltransferase [Austwickia sp.]|nr:MAG: bifunctional PIG-L family deacetylase/class I SAM-dependent methyltransferase [Austwickia sp.]